jgi:hypothetical protein
MAGRMHGILSIGRARTRATAPAPAPGARTPRAAACRQRRTPWSSSGPPRDRQRWPRACASRRPTLVEVSEVSSDIIRQ